MQFKKIQKVFSHCFFVIMKELTNVEQQPQPRFPLFFLARFLLIYICRK